MSEVFEEVRSKLVESICRPSWFGDMLEQHRCAAARGVSWDEYRDLLRLAQNRALKRVSDGK